MQGETLPDARAAEEGHAGHEFNERADHLAVAASNGTNHIIDEVYEKENPNNQSQSMSSWQPKN